MGQVEWNDMAFYVYENVVCTCGHVMMIQGDTKQQWCITPSCDQFEVPYKVRTVELEPANDRLGIRDFCETYGVEIE